MINRVNKLAAVLVAATTIASLAPAAVNAAERLATKEGTIENAIAFDNGNYVYDGYMTDDDETGLYFNNGSKDSFLEEDEDYDFSTNYADLKYGEKYVVIEEDGDDYLLDLSTGKILDDETIDDIRENLESKLKTTFNKVDRYVKLTSAVPLTQILEGQFGEVWYQYAVTADDEVDGTKPVEAVQGVASLTFTEAPASVSFGGSALTYSDLDELKNAIETATAGKYDIAKNIDGTVFTLTQKAGQETELAVTTDSAAALASLGFEVEGNGITAEVSKAGSAFKAGTQATAITARGFVNQSGKYIDASVTANITVAKENGDVVKVAEYNKAKDGVMVQLTGIEPIAQDENNIYAIATVSVTGTHNDGTKKYIQKISKAQGSTKDDAKLPNKVESYLLTDEANNYYLDGKNTDFTKASTLLKSGNIVRVVNGTLQVTKVGSDNVEVSTIKLKKAKLTEDSNKNGTKNDLYVAELDEQEDQDMESTQSYSIDAEGNTWVLNSGKIYKFDKDEFKQVYNCDRSMDMIDVYNSENLIVWEEGEDVFATVGGNTVSADEEEKEENTDSVVKAGWVKNADGTWSYVEANGTKKTGWLNDNGTWYMLKADGVMATGWYNDRGTWYYLQPSGAMKTGWLNDNGTWYYLQSSGAMKTGWLKDTDGRWYFLKSSGAMAVNTTIDGYVLGANGAWIR